MEQQELEVNKDKLIYIRWALIFASYYLIEKWDDAQIEKLRRSYFCTGIANILIRDEWLFQLIMFILISLRIILFAISYVSVEMHKQFRFQFLLTI